MLKTSKQTQIEMHTIGTPLTIGLSFDTRDDFRFVSEEPEDWDAEFAVSEAVDDIAHALEDSGHKVRFIGSGRKLLDNFHDIENSVDMVFNIAEGYYGRAREAQIPAMLELAGLPYVGSDAYTLALALNKWHTKVLALQYGIRTPDFCIVRNHDDIEKCKPKRFPVITKLCCDGSSKGLREDSVAHNPSELNRSVEYLLRTYKQHIVVEEFIEGKEIDVPIVGTFPSKAFGVVGITMNGNMELNDKFLTSKIIRGDSHGFKYPLDEPFVQEAEKNALMIYNLIECRDFGRVDMRIDKQGQSYLLEINPYPFLGKHSSFNEIAKTGIGYKNMIGMILQSALQRQTIRRHA